MKPNPDTGSPRKAAPPETELTVVWLLMIAASAELMVPTTLIPDVKDRYFEAAFIVSLALGSCVLVGRVWNLMFGRSWRPESYRRVSFALVIVVGLGIHGSWPHGQIPSREEIARIRAGDSASQEPPKRNEDGMVPYTGPVLPEHRCPKGQVFKFEHCIDKPERYVKRGVFGGCPAGYVDHPATPELCTLPAVAAHMAR